MRVIIPSAKLIPDELQMIGKLPAVVYPLNQRIVFDYLHEQYSDADFNVVVFENAKEVEATLKRYSRTNIIRLDFLKDIAYSVQVGLKHKSFKGADSIGSSCLTDGCAKEDQNVVVNFGDTIVFDGSAASADDYYFYAEDEISDTWTFFEEDNGKILRIIDKRAGTGTVGKLFCGVFKFSHSDYLSQCIMQVQENPAEGCSIFYQALQLYSKRYPMLPVKAEEWFDVGHAERYSNSQIEVKAREFNHIQIDKARGILTKTSNDVEKFIGEIKWYLKLPNGVSYVRPRIFKYSTEYTKPYVSMEYYSYHTVHELFLYGDLTKHQWTDIFKRIRFVYDDFQKYGLRDDHISASLEEMYLTKTFHRLDEMRSSGKFEAFFLKDITVNGKRYPSLNEIRNVLKDVISPRLCSIDELHIIHGDLCFSNIMIDGNLSFIKIVDPRGKFGEYDIYGDSRYELAKLFHSVDGKYDFIIKNLFAVSYRLDDAVIEYSIADRKRDYDLYELLLEIFREEIGNELKNIEIIEALLFLSMIPLHGESIDHQMVMLAVGLDILNRAIGIEEGAEHV